MKSTMIMMVAVLAFGALFLPSVQATAEAEVMVKDTCHGTVGAGVGKGTCQSSGCSGAVTVAVGSGNCHGGPGEAGCDASVASLTVGNSNCHGGDGRPGQDGGIGCGDGVNIILGNNNCHGGDGGDADDGDDG